MSGALDEARRMSRDSLAFRSSERLRLPRLSWEEAVLVVVQRHARDLVAEPVQVAFEWLDLDDLRAKVGERRADRRHHHHRCRFDDANT
jgi:hypothetical protein